MVYVSWPLSTMIVGWLFGIWVAVAGAGSGGVALIIKEYVVRWWWQISSGTSLQFQIETATWIAATYLMRRPTIFRPAIITREQ